MKLDILSFGAHPDDVELGCGGTLLAHTGKGIKAGIIDLTHGELSTRGNPEIRDEEAKRAAVILRVSIRENMGFADGFFCNDNAHRKKVIGVIRRYMPDIVLINAFDDRHPDHERAAQLISDSCFLAGLRKIETRYNGKKQEAWRPRAVFHYMQFRSKKPDILVDISAHIDGKMKAIKAHRSQFYNPASDEPQTLISAPGFLEQVIAKARELGGQIGVRYAEGFTCQRSIGVNNLFDLL